MKDLVNEGREVQKKFISSLREADNYVNVSPEYLQQLRKAMIADLKKNPTVYTIGSYEPSVDDSHRPGATGGAEWFSHQTGITILATPFWEDQLGIPVEIIDADGNYTAKYPAKATYNIVNKLSTDLAKDVRLVREAWKAIVTKAIDSTR